MEKKRSKGVTIFGCLLIILSIRNLFYTVGEVWLIISRPQLTWSSKLVTHILIQALIGVFFLILGLDILHLKSWAQKAIVYVSWIALIIGILSIVLLMPLNIASKLFALIFGLSYLIFFTRPKVKEQFR